MNFTINSKEKVYFIVMAIISFLIYGLALLNPNATLVYKAGICLLVIGIFSALNFLGSLFFIGNLKGNAIKINKKQFPDIFEILEVHSKKLDLKKTPDMYLLQGNGILNAFATRFAKRDYVVLHSNVLEAAYQEGIDAVSFIIGHELGHIKRKHTSCLKAFLILPAQLIPFLGNAYSRACEYTCDNIGYNLCPEGALKGILILTAGKKLYKKVNISELILNIKYERAFAISFAEFFSTHPALVKRISTIHELNRDNLTPDINSFFSPKIDIQQSQEAQ